MNNSKNLIKFGIASLVIGLGSLVYNFFSMYSLAAKCPENIDLQPCQAYDNWQLINQIGITLLVAGLIVLAIGILKRQRNN
jgi:hypothetical protein